MYSNFGLLEGKCLTYTTLSRAAAEQTLVTSSKGRGSPRIPRADSAGLCGEQSLVSAGRWACVRFCAVAGCLLTWWKIAAFKWENVCCKKESFGKWRLCWTVLWMVLIYPAFHPHEVLCKCGNGAVRPYLHIREKREAIIMKWLEKD